MKWVMKWVMKWGESLIKFKSEDQQLAAGGLNDEQISRNAEFNHGAGGLNDEQISRNAEFNNGGEQQLAAGALNDEQISRNAEFNHGGEQQLAAGALNDEQISRNAEFNHGGEQQLAAGALNDEQISRNAELNHGGDIAQILLPISKAVEFKDGLREEDASTILKASVTIIVDEQFESLDTDGFYINPNGELIYRSGEQTSTDGLMGMLRNFNGNLGKSGLMGSWALWALYVLYGKAIFPVHNRMKFVYEIRGRGFLLTPAEVSNDRVLRKTKTREHFSQALNIAVLRCLEDPNSDPKTILEILEKDESSLKLSKHTLTALLLGNQLQP